MTERMAITLFLQSTEPRPQTMSPSYVPAKGGYVHRSSDV